MDHLQVERIGGFAGFGGPHLKARGEVAVSSLPPHEKRVVDRLFLNPGSSAQKGEADAFRYRITRQTGSGPQVIELPGDSVPSILKDAVREVLE